MKQIVVIGAGPSGLMAGITIKEEIIKQNKTEEVNVLILEKNERIGKKLLSTGNGRCNYSNINLLPNYYNNQEFVKPILEKLPNLENWFSERGLISRVDEEGRIYPLSFHSGTVVDLFRLLIEKNDIILKTSFDVKRITKQNNQYIIFGNNEKIIADYIIISTGGKAAPILGSNGSGYALLKEHNIKVTHTSPGLVGLITTKDTVRGLSGLRMKCNALVYNDDYQLLYQEAGEIQFKDDGISGIVIMNVVSKIMHYKSKPIFEIDLLPSFNEKKIKKYILDKIKYYSNIKLTYLFTGLFQNAFSTKLLKDLSFAQNKTLSSLKEDDIDRIIEYIKHYRVEYTDTYGFERAQVTIGGVDLNEINKSLELKKLPNVFVCGEIIDIDGMCGGYNLHFAFASGFFVGKEIIEKLKEGTL